MLHTAIFAWNFFSVTPFWDIWNWIEDYQTYFNGHYTFHDLIKPHNEHRIATTRLVLFVDGWLCDMTGRFTVTLNFLLLVVLGCLLGHLASPRGISRLRSAAYLALAVAWTTSTCQWIDLVLPFQIQFAFLCLSIVAAAASLARATSPLLTQGWAAIWASIAGICYLAGVFSMAGGMLALPSLLVLLVARRARLLPAASFCLVAAASVFLFLFQYHPPPVEPPTLPITPSKALTLLQFAAQFLGAAFYSVATLPLIAGSAALATYGVAAVLIVRDFTSRRFGISGRLHIAFATTGSFIVIAFAAGVARASGGMAGSIEPRYALVSLLFLGSIVCLPMLLTPSGGHANWRFPRATQAVGATLFACAIVICNGLPRYGREARSFHDGLAANADAMRRNVFVPNLFASMFYGQPAELSARLAFLAKHHLSVFAPSASPDPPSLSQKPAAQNVTLPDCAGHFDLLYPEDESRSILRGWLASPPGKRSADWIEPVPQNGSTAAIIPVSQDRGAVRVDGHKIHSIEGIYTGIAQPAESAGRAPIVAAIGLFRDRPDLTCLYHMPAPAGAWRVQTLASIGKTFPAIPAGSAAITGGFRVNGVNGMAKLFAPFSNQALYATAAAGDQAEGEVSFALAPKPGEDIVVPFATGPDVTGQGIAVGFADGTRSEIAVPYDYRVESEWRAFTLSHDDVARHGGSPIVIVAKDSGSSWGQWLAVGEPMYTNLDPAWAKLY